MLVCICGLSLGLLFGLKRKELKKEARRKKHWVCRQCSAGGRAGVCGQGWQGSNPKPTPLCQNVRAGNVLLTEDPKQRQRRLARRVAPTPDPALRVQATCC